MTNLLNLQHLQKFLMGGSKTNIMNKISDLIDGLCPFLNLIRLLSIYTFVCVFVYLVAAICISLTCLFIFHFPLSIHEWNFIAGMSDLFSGGVFIIMGLGYVLLPSIYIRSSTCSKDHLW